MYAGYPKGPERPKRTPIQGKKKNRMRKFRGKRVMPNGEPKAHNKGHLPSPRKDVICSPSLGGGKAPYYEVNGVKMQLPPGLTKYNGTYKSLED